MTACYNEGIFISISIPSAIFWLLFYRSNVVNSIFLDISLLLDLSRAFVSFWSSAQLLITVLVSIIFIIVVNLRLTQLKGNAKLSLPVHFYLCLSTIFNGALTYLRCITIISDLGKESVIYNMISPTINSIIYCWRN